MRAPLSWIREFTPVNQTPADIADALNQLGLEVEAIEEPGRDINGVIAARILDVVPHPDADRIRLADIEFGGGKQLRVVCGAPNIEAGMIVPFAQVGAVLPGDFKIEKRKIRGVVSEGMLCSARELGLGEDHSGILTLPAGTELGGDVREVLGLNDVVFDLAITPNRPDAMGVVGIARELSAHFGLPFDVDEDEREPIGDNLAGTQIVVEAADRCPRFVGLVTRVEMGESPDWMQRRLVLAGMRPISNVVDVTNYVMLERCRPLHAFDLDGLAGRGIVVRLATEGETMTTLDGVERKLTTDDLLICDAERSPQAIAGIMGGAAAEVSESTTSILIESAYFDASGIAKSSKRLGLRSEASARFERGVDPNGCASGAARALRLLEQVAGAWPTPGAIDVYPAPIEPALITVRTARVNQLLGSELSDDDVAAYLTPLGIAVRDKVAIAPTWRPDLEREIDIVEEVARRIGLDNITRTIPSSPAKVGALTPAQRDRRTIADVLVGAGYDETFSLPLLAPIDLARAGDTSKNVVEVENPLRADESILRPAILPGLLRAIGFNAAHGEPAVALFEMGTVFAPPQPGETLPVERMHLAFARADVVRRAPHEPDRGIDVYDATSVLDALGQELRLANVRYEPARVAGFRAGRHVSVTVDDGFVIGTIGEIANDVVAEIGAVAPVVACELDVGALLAAARRERRASPVSRYPAATIDLAFVVDDAVPAVELEATIARAAGDLLEDLRLFDVFRSDALGLGRVSLAFALRFRAPDRTLTDEEVGALRSTVIDSVRAVHGAELRA